VLFAAIVVFSALVWLRLRRTTGWLAWLGAGAALISLGRLVAEALRPVPAALNSTAPIAFPALVGSLATVVWRRPLRAD